MLSLPRWLFRCVTAFDMTQPESPSHFGGKIYEMMNMALSNKWGPQQPSFDMHSSQPQEAEIVAEPQPTLEAEVVEPVESGSQKGIKLRM
ncbi:hypothetical protein Tco_0526859 [Tanacetum coccineum]